MAAYAALVSLEETTDLILNHPKYSISIDEREQITSIREYVICLITFLDDFPDKANRLEGKLRHLANEAEDLIENLMWNQMRKNPGSIGFTMVSQLKKLGEEMGSITGDMMDDRRSAAVSSLRVAATVKNDVVIGLEADLLEIKGRLCGESYKVEVIPISGMGGIGKTTLAQKAYDDPSIIDYFDIRVWVTVSQDYSVDKILSCLGHIVPVELLENNEISMGEKVYTALRGRRYLIVVDDIWGTDVWDDVRGIFPDDKNGSRIILTTRLSDVAAYASKGSPVHEMKFMDEGQSWKLLKQKLFSEGQDCPLELEEIGIEIARGCRGLPLAVVLIAGILSTNSAKSRASWEKIAQNVNQVFDVQLEEILSFSYTLLPHHLRPCFLFMAGFPEDHNIHVSSLIKLWVAEGFLTHRNGDKSLEEEAEEYVEDLVKRDLVMVTCRKSNGKIKSCSLHDLVRDMCIRKAEEEMFLLTDRYKLPNGRRRISIRHSRLDEIWGETIHTILSFPILKDGSSLTFLERFKLLRVLDIMHEKLKFSTFPKVLVLFLLRYLAVRVDGEIPAAILNLEYLQTLIICPSRKLDYFAFVPSLPLEIWRMSGLRHLIITHDFCYVLPDPTDGSALPLQNLQTISGVSSFVCSERILKMIPNLKKLGIVRRHNHINLVNLHQLEELKITTSPFKKTWPSQLPTLPLSLKKLTLDCKGLLSWNDMSIIGSMSNLEVLKLKQFACDGYTWETNDGEFRQLKFLHIEHSTLERWVTESIHFPRLERLVLRCSSLREIPVGIGEIPTLEMIEVDAWNEALVLSAKRIQEEQQKHRNDALQVRQFRCVDVRKYYL